MHSREPMKTQGRAGVTALRAVLFDWDGTLLDSWHADLAAYRKMFHTLGILWGEADLRRHYSPNWYHVYRAAGLPREIWAEADRLWQEYYREQRPQLLPGARGAVERLARRVRLGLVTSGNGARVRRQLREFGLARLFAARIFAEDPRERKPHPAPLQLALERLKLPATACLYVGDAPEDVEMARRAKVRMVGVLGPFPTHRRLRAARPDALLRSVRELPALLSRRGWL
jgi:HAD superfamily hydrolase (TIGR01549 family)